MTALLLFLHIGSRTRAPGIQIACGLEVALTLSLVETFADLADGFPACVDDVDGSGFGASETIQIIQEELAEINYNIQSFSGFILQSMDNSGAVSE